MTYEIPMKIVGAVLSCLLIYVLCKQKWGKK